LYFEVRVRCRSKKFTFASSSPDGFLIVYCMLVSWFCPFVFICLFQQMAIQKQPSPNFTHRHRSRKGYKVKGQGHATTTMKISASPRFLIHFLFMANSAFHPSGVGKWVPASAGKAEAGMVQSVSGCTRGAQVKLWDALRMRAIPERLRGVITTRRYTNPRLPLPLPLPLLFSRNCILLK